MKFVSLSLFLFISTVAWADEQTWTPPSELCTATLTTTVHKEGVDEVGDLKMLFKDSPAADKNACHDLAFKAVAAEAKKFCTDKTSFKYGYSYGTNHTIVDANCNGYTPKKGFVSTASYKPIAGKGVRCDYYFRTKLGELRSQGHLVRKATETQWKWFGGYTDAQDEEDCKTRFQANNLNLVGCATSESYEVRYHAVGATDWKLFSGPCPHGVQKRRVASH